MRFRLFVLICAFCSSGPAWAQPEIGSLIDRNREAVGSVRSETNAAAREVMNTYGRCVARNRTRRAETILGLPLMSSEQNDALRDFFEDGDTCLGNDIGQLRFNYLAIAGAMSEWFVLNRYADVGLGRVAQFGEQTSDLSRSGYEAIATCIARTDPAAAFALIETRPASAQERAVLGRIIPSVAPCLPRGENTFNRSSLRATIATGLYRLLVVASASTAAAVTERN
jgi:hypothetical protein